MYKYLTKNGQLLAFGLGLALTVIFLISVFSGLDEFSALPEDQRGTTGIFNFGLFAFAVLFVIGILAMVGFGLFQVFSDLKGSMKGLIGIAALVIIFFVARSVGSDDTAIMDTINNKDYNVTSDSISQGITGGIVTTLFMCALALLTFVVSEVRNFFK